MPDLIPINSISSPQNSTLSSDFSFFGKATDINNVQSVPDILNLFFMAALSIGAILAVLRIVYAGYLYTTSDIWGNKSKAKEVVQQAIIGLVMLLSVWVVLNTINPDLLNLNVLRSIKSDATIQATPQAANPPSGI